MIGQIIAQNCAAELRRIAPNCARRDAPPLDRLERDDDDRPVEQALAQRAGALDLDGDRAAVVRLGAWIAFVRLVTMSRTNCIPEPVAVPR